MLCPVSALSTQTHQVVLLSFLKVVMGSPFRLVEASVAASCSHLWTTGESVMGDRKNDVFFFH